MAKTEIPSDSYKRFQGDFRAVKNMSVAGFIKWVKTLYESAYYEGWGACIDVFKGSRGRVSIDDTVEASILDEGELRDILLSVKGIGERRTEEVLARIGGAHEKTE